MESTKTDLKGKNVLITGASSGIGKACSKLFAEKKARVILCARRKEKLNALAKELNEEFDAEIYVVEMDVSKLSSVENALTHLPPEWSEIEILVNSAGMASGLDRVQEEVLSDIDVMVDTNIKGLVYVTHFILKGMIKRNKGHIINLGSISSHFVYTKGAVYCATKHATQAFTQGLRIDLAGTKVRVSLISPGLVKSEFNLVRFKQDEKMAESSYSNKQTLSPEDVADSIIYCVTTPTHINIDEIIIMPQEQVAMTELRFMTEI